MKKVLLFAMFVHGYTLVFSQYKTFVTNSDTFEIFEFPRTLKIDSCLIVAKEHPDWQIPDTAQLRDINLQWFGRNHEHMENVVTVIQDIEGFSFLSSNNYQVDDYIAVQMRKPMIKMVAFLNGDEFYNLLLVRKKK